MLTTQSLPYFCWSPYVTNLMYFIIIWSIKTTVKSHVVEQMYRISMIIYLWIHLANERHINNNHNNISKCMHKHKNHDTVWECISIFVEKVKRDLEIYYFSRFRYIFIILLNILYVHKILPGRIIN